MQVKRFFCPFCHTFKGEGVIRVEDALLSVGSEGEIYQYADGTRGVPAELVEYAESLTEDSDSVSCVDCGMPMTWRDYDEYPDAEIKELELASLSEDAKEILHMEHDGAGTVCTVYIGSDGQRHYRAFEYIDERLIGGGLQGTYGYDTTEMACYMGQRYDIPSLWGPYWPEVFTHDVQPFNNPPG